MKIFKVFLAAVVVIAVLSSVTFAATAQQFYNFGMKLYNARNYTKAISYFKNAAKADKENPEYFRAIGNCYEKMGDSAKAQKFYAFADKMGGSSGNSSSSGKKFRISPFAGFTTVNMGELNAFIIMMSTGYPGSSYTYGKQTMSGGLLLGLDAGFAVIPNLYIGPKIEFIAPGDAKVTSDYTYSFPGYTETTHSERVWSVSIIPLLVGATYDYVIPNSQFAIGGGLHLGYGFASGMEKDSYKSTETGYPDYEDTSEYNFSGSAFVAEISAIGNYRISDMFAAGLNLGYRIANVSEMKYTKVPDGSYYKVGDKVPYWKEGWTEGKPLPFDFGGFVISAKASFSF